MPRYTYTHVRNTHPYNLSALSCYLSTAAVSDRYSELMPYTVLATLSGLVSTLRTNTKIIPINNNDYSCHITTVELVLPIVWGPYHAMSRH